MSRLTAILFDIGWPIIDETEMHKAWNQHLKVLMQKITGRLISDAEIEKYESEAVRCYAPSLFSYVIWQLAKPDEGLFYRLRGEFDRFDFCSMYSLQPDAIATLRALHQRFKLGIAANQPENALRYLKKLGILEFFDSCRVSGEIGFSKPDVRLFLRVLDDLKSKAEESIMVGDRIDNDIIPAKLVGMRTILISVGPHRHQEPRYPNENPDFRVSALSEILSLPPICGQL